MYPGLTPDYIAVTEPDHLRPIATVDAQSIVAVAAHVGGTRLIDNMILGEGVS